MSRTTPRRSGPGGGAVTIKRRLFIVGPHPGSQYLAPALALGSPVLAPQGHPTSGYLVKSPLTISFASVRVRSCELRRYNHPRHTLTTNRAQDQHWSRSHQNSAVKRARARVVPGWVTSWEVLEPVGSGNYLEWVSKLMIPGSSPRRRKKPL